MILSLNKENEAIMNYLVIQEIFKNRSFYILLSAVVLWFYVGFYFGKKAGFIPKHVQCKDIVYQLESCNDLYQQEQKRYAQEIIDAKALCLKDKCQRLCTEQVQQAIESYKALDREFECGSDL